MAEALGLSEARVEEILAGRRSIRMGEIPALSRFLRLPVWRLVYLATGDRGYPTRTEPHDSAIEEDLPSVASQRTFKATKDVLETMVSHGLEDMTPEEIRTYALVIAQAATRAESRAEGRPRGGSIVDLEAYRGPRSEG